MTAPAVNFSPSDRPPPSLISPSPCTAWATSLGLHLNVLHDHIRSSAPEIYGSNSDELVSMMKSAGETVAGAAALRAARAALAPFAQLYAQISSIQGHDNTPAPHIPTQISPETRNLPILHPSTSSPTPSDTRKRPLAPTYAEIAAHGIANKANSPRAVPRPRPDRANRQAAALFNVPDPGRSYSSGCASLV